MEVTDVIKFLQRRRFVISNEKNLQVEIEHAFSDEGIPFTREVRLDEENIIDFMIGRIGIEIKIQGRKRAIYWQLCRYAEFADVEALILITTISLGLPAEINKKKVIIINPSRAWL